MSTSLGCCEILHSDPLNPLSSLQGRAVSVLCYARGSAGWLRSSHSYSGFTRPSATRLGSRIQVAFRSVSHLFIPRLWLKEKQAPGHGLLLEIVEAGRDWQKLTTSLTAWDPGSRTSLRVLRLESAGQGCRDVCLTRTEGTAMRSPGKRLGCIILSQKRSSTGSNNSDC